MKRILTVIVGLGALLVGLGFILPALARLKAQEALPQVALLSFGVMVALGGAGAACCGVRKRTAK